MSRTIRVDDEVFAKLQSIAEPFVDTPNSALRKLLGLAASASSEETAAASGGGQGDQSLAPLLADGRLTAGQRLVWRRRNLHQKHHATVQTNGALLLDDGTTHNTPSGAASHLAGNPQNGWKAWATESGTLLKDLR